MKMIYRKNTILDKTRMENDAEHSRTITLMAVVFCEYASSDIDITRVIKMLLFHNLVEIYAGDTYFLDNDHNSKKQEKDAAEKLYHLLPEDQYDEFLEIWTEFEEMKMQNSIYANAIDRLQLFLLDSYTDGYSWKDGNINEQ